MGSTVDAGVVTVAVNVAACVPVGSFIILAAEAVEIVMVCNEFMAVDVSICRGGGSVNDVVVKSKIRCSTDADQRMMMVLLSDAVEAVTVVVVDVAAAIIVWWWVAKTGIEVRSIRMVCT